MLVSIVNDKKSLFISHFWFAFCYHFSMLLRYNIVFHFQTNEQTKRQNQILEQYLKCYVNYQQNNWATLLWIAMYVYNNAWRSIIKINSYQAMFETKISGAELLKKTCKFRNLYCTISCSNDYKFTKLSIWSFKKDENYIN